jgi:uncharacterized membrane protein
MDMSLAVHVAAGIGGLATGFVAIAVAKGSALHRRSGVVFVYTMVVLALTGAAIAAVKLAGPAPKPIFVPTMFMGLLTAYLVVTALTAVRTPSPWTRRLDRIGLPAAALIGVVQLVLGVRALVIPGKQPGIVTGVELAFGTIALLAAWSDLRIMRFGPPVGAQRIARHLWRMTVALWIAVLSFMPRLNRFLPGSLRPLTSVPMVVVLILLLYWLWRVRFRRSLRGLIGVSAAVPA